MSQTNANDYGNIGKALNGAKYDIAPDTVRSRAAEAAVPFGLAVTYGTNPEKECVVIDANTDTFFGVSLHTHTKIVTGDTPQYDIAETVSVLEKGAVWVEVTSDVVSGAPAFVDVANGKFTDVATDNLAVPGGTFETSAVSGELAALKIL